MGPSLYALTICASAFLIFFVQPMVGKRILPWFGGSPGVWTLCLAFYQLTLFAGYAYAHWLARFVAPRRQLLVHGALFGVAFALLPVLPDQGWRPRELSDPSARILGMLLASVGPPFLMLAATGTLVQVWFARRFPGRSPYPLYALSNVGSLSALVAYPFAIEPGLTLSEQSRVWSVGFVATGLLVLLCAWLARAGGGAATPDAGSGSAGATPPTPSRVSLWLLLPACGVVLLMGVTSTLCLDIASVPFLWIVPLALYLTTFIVCFGSERLYRRGVWAGLAAVATVLHFGVVFGGLGWELWPGLSRSFRVQLFSYAFLLFACCMLLHGELYRLRPPARSLTSFYLCIAGGGAAGGLFVGLLAPRIFSAYHELPLGVAACWLLWTGAGHAGARRSGGSLLGALAVACAAIAMVAFGTSRRASVEGSILAQERNFFGVLRVREHRPDDPQLYRRSLWSGTTMHGQQFASPRLRGMATKYYGSASAIGFLFSHLSSSAPRHVGVIGLGVGTLAAYGRPGDRFVFYEIDPDVIRLARDGEYFDYLAESRATVEIVPGDARLALEAALTSGEGSRFDLLVLDAFNSDAIPVHLLTEEAFRLYGRHLAPDGFLALHISNRHLDLAPLVLRLAATIDLDGVEFLNRELPARGTSRAKWVVLHRNDASLGAFLRFSEARIARAGLAPGAIQVRAREPHELAATPLWTDDYSDLLGVLKPARSR